MCYIHIHTPLPRKPHFVNPELMCGHGLQGVDACTCRWPDLWEESIWSCINGLNSMGLFTYESAISCSHDFCIIKMYNEFPVIIERSVTHMRTKHFHSSGHVVHLVFIWCSSLFVLFSFPFVYWVPVRIAYG